MLESSLQSSEGRSSSPPTGGESGSRLLVCLPSMPESERVELLSRLTECATPSRIIVTSPDWTSGVASDGALTMVACPPRHSDWIPTAEDYRVAASVARDKSCDSLLLLGNQAGSLQTSDLRGLIDGVAAPSAGIVIPRYELGPHDGLVNTAILQPLTRSLYGVAIHFPLPLDIAFTAVAAERLALAASRSLRSGPDALLWPVAEASAAGLRIAESACGRRAVPAPPSDDLNSLISTVVGSLFADTDAKAPVWQRARAIAVPPSPVPRSTPSLPASDEVRTLLSGFCNAYTNLHELWALVLPPQSLLGLKRLSRLPADEFVFPDELWVRIVYDFLLAHRLRTMIQVHLLGALTPLYLAWVASHLRQTAEDPQMVEQQLQRLTSAFERDRSYLLARWRWPDRFNS